MPKKIASHLVVPWKIGQALLIFLVAWIGVPLLIALIAGVLSNFWNAAAIFANAIQDGNIEVSFILDIITALSALGMVYMYLRRYKLGWTAVGWRRTSLWRTLGYFAAGFFGFLILVSAVIALVSALSPNFNANQAQSNDFTGSIKTHRSLTLIALVLIPPIIEETVFRGFIFPAIATKWGTWAGAIISSALFGIAHFQWNISIYTFVLGLVLCFLYTKLKSIFPGMAIHMLNNLLAFYALTMK